MAKNGKYSRQKGHNYELQIIKELSSIGYKGLKSSRSESKNLDDDKIDIAETEDKLPCYIQAKKTQSIPSYFKIQEECTRKDRPLVVIWNAQERKEGNVNITSKGEVAIMPKKFFYHLIHKKEEPNGGID